MTMPSVTSLFGSDLVSGALRSTLKQVQKNCSFLNVKQLTKKERRKEKRLQKKLSQQYGFLLKNKNSPSCKALLTTPAKKTNNINKNKNNKFNRLQKKFNKFTSHASSASASSSSGGGGRFKKISNSSSSSSSSADEELESKTSSPGINPPQLVRDSDSGEEFSDSDLLAPGTGENSEFFDAPLEFNQEGPQISAFTLVLRDKYAPLNPANNTVVVPTAGKQSMELAPVQSIQLPEDSTNHDEDDDGPTNTFGTVQEANSSCFPATIDSSGGSAQDEKDLIDMFSPAAAAAGEKKNKQNSPKRISLTETLSSSFIINSNGVQTTTNCLNNGDNNHNANKHAAEDFPGVKKEKSVVVDKSNSNNGSPTTGNLISFDDNNGEKVDNNLNGKISGGVSENGKNPLGKINDKSLSNGSGTPAVVKSEGGRKLVDFDIFSRKSAENGRKTGEGGKTAIENERKSVETNKNAGENGRKISDNGQNSVGTEKKTVENGKSPMRTGENERKILENGKKTLENGKSPVKTCENERKTVENGKLLTPGLNGVVKKPMIQSNLAGFVMKQSSSSSNSPATPNAAKKKPEDNNFVKLPEPKVVLYDRNKIRPSWRTKLPIGCGFINLGNTCYMNATLQALFHTPAFLNWLLDELNEHDHRNRCDRNNQSQHQCTICPMSQSVFGVYNRSGNPIRPVHIHNKLRTIGKNFSYGRQEDAHEFLRLLLESMERSYLTAIGGHRLDNRSKETTPLGQIFGGYTRGEVRCLTCRHVSTTFHPHAELQLDIREVNNVEDALAFYFQKEKLDNNDYKCEKCKTVQPATKQQFMELAPIVLCIQLKRFRACGSKIKKPIFINEKLNLSRFMHNRNTNTEAEYKLVGLVTHMGPSPNCGHYTAIAQACNGNYYQFDDSYVRMTSLNHAQNADAYVIIYETTSKRAAGSSGLTPADHHSVFKSSASSTATSSSSSSRSQSTSPKLRNSPPSPTSNGQQIGSPNNSRPSTPHTPKPISPIRTTSNNHTPATLTGKSLPSNNTNSNSTSLPSKLVLPRTNTNNNSIENSSSSWSSNFGKKLQESPNNSSNNKNPFIPRPLTNNGNNFVTKKSSLLLGNHHHHHGMGVKKFSINGSPTLGPSAKIFSHSSSSSSSNNSFSSNNSTKFQSTRNPPFGGAGGNVRPNGTNRFLTYSNNNNNSSSNSQNKSKLVTPTKPLVPYPDDDSDEEDCNNPRKKSKSPSPPGRSLKFSDSGNHRADETTTTTGNNNSNKKDTSSSSAEGLPTTLKVYATPAPPQIKTWNSNEDSKLGKLMEMDRKRPYVKSKEEAEDEDIDSGRTKKKAKPENYVSILGMNPFDKASERFRRD